MFSDVPLGNFVPRVCKRAPEKIVGLVSLIKY